MSVYMFQMSSSFCVFRQTGNGTICGTSHAHGQSAYELPAIQFSL